MTEIDVFMQYFAASCEFAGVSRKGAAVRLTACSDAGQIRYSVSVSFFPHRDDEDFAVSYDAYAERVLFAGKGRRSKKKEEAYLSALQTEADAAAETLSGTIFWDQPLTEPRRG